MPGALLGDQQSDWEHGDTATIYVATNPYRSEDQPLGATP